jgi:hypothetical protein
MRRDLKLSPRLRELAMCAVAVVNDAQYEYVHHAPLYIEAGATPEQAQALRDIDAAAADQTLFDELDRAVLAFTIESTRHVKIADATFARARQLLGSDRLMFELIATVARTFNGLLRARGGVSEFAAGALRHLRARGLVDTGARGYVSIDSGGEGFAQVMRANARQVRDGLIAAGVAADDLDRYVELLADPDTIISSSVLISSWGRRP